MKKNVMYAVIAFTIGTIIAIAGWCINPTVGMYASGIGITIAWISYELVKLFLRKEEAE